MLSFDTNILVYAADRHAGARHTESVTLLSAAAWRGAALTEQSLIEFLNVATRKRNQPLVAASAIVRNWLQLFPLLLPPASIVDDTLSFLTSYRLSIWDAHMLATCASNGCHALISEDLADGAHYGPVQVLSPFNPHNASLIGNLLGP